MGGGRGIGRGGSGRRMFSGWKLPEPQEPPQTEQQISELEALRQQAQALQQQLDTTGKRIEEASKRDGQATTLRALVDKERCIGCGVSISVRKGQLLWNRPEKDEERERSQVKC